MLTQRSDIFNGRKRFRLDEPDLKTDKNQETFEHLMKGIKNLACFGGNAVFVTAPIVIDGNVIVVTVSEPSLNDRMYHNLSPHFNKKGVENED